LLPKGIVVAGVGSMADSLRAKQTQAREMVITVATPHGPLRLVGNPIKLQNSCTQYAPPPLLGEHSEEISSQIAKTVVS
jgi:crotonobetainyl-CoA:carnitine CoA-transferase CaiB-like acyl-CoA transferase